MVAQRKEAEQIVSLSKYQKLQAEHQDLLETHLRIVKEKDQKIHQLEKQIRFREDLDGVSAEVMSQNQKAAQYTVIKAIETAEQTENGRVLLKNTDQLAKSAGMSLQTFQKCLTHNDKIGSIKKETLPVRDKEGQIIYTETYVRPTILTFTPKSYTTERPRNHGGERLFCEGCGSDKIEKIVTYLCKNCGKLHTEKPNGKSPDDRVNEDDCEATSEFDNPPVEPVEPETQFAFSVKNEAVQKRNLTLLSNNYLQTQLDATVDENEEEDESNSAPPLCPLVPADPMSILKEWLEKRRGTPRYGYSTGSLETAKKYRTKKKPLLEDGRYVFDEKGKKVLIDDEDPDIESFIAGNKNHIYTSRLNNPETGLTQVVCFECDTPEHSEIAMNSMSALARAGIGAIYHERQRERAHFEVYFDQPVDPQVAYQMLLEIDPDLEEVSEIFPCKATENRTDHPLSWPMWQRIGGQVYVCTAKAILPAPHDGAMREVDPSDLEALAQLVTDAVTPSALVEEFAIVLAERSKLQPREQEIEGMGGGAIGIKPQIITQFKGQDLVPQVLADFDAQHSWDEIAVPCGGLVENRFCAIWRGSKSRSVVIDPRNEKYAHDYGQVGSYRSHFDKHQVWCYIHGKDRTADIAERCVELRSQQSATTSVAIVPTVGIDAVAPIATPVAEVALQEPASELFPTERKPVYYTPCIVCCKPKTVVNASGMYTCGTDHSKEASNG